MLNRFGGLLGNIIHKAAAGKLEEKFSARIPDDRVRRRDASGQLVPASLGEEFKPNQNYLQIMVNQMYVRQDRTLWVQREHLGAVWMGFRYNGAVQSVPFMVGRDLLIDRVQKLPQGARVEFRDVRVGKVYPYTGDSVALYLGLWSTPTTNWASTVFSALDTIAGKVRVAASLTQVLDMVDVLNQGISTVLGLNDIQAHLNLYQEFQDPTVGEVGLLRPGFYVMVDAPRDGFEASNLSVLDGMLYSRTDSNGQLAPFYDRDFLLYSISSLPHLSTGVDMFGNLYDGVLSALIGSKEDLSKLALAAHEYHRLQTGIVTSPDLTRTDKNHLIEHYAESLSNDAVRLVVNLEASNVPFSVYGAPEVSEGVRQPLVDYEAQSARLDRAALLADPAVSAGLAAARFATMVQTITEGG
jgi:hypothetical protein